MRFVDFLSFLRNEADADREAATNNSSATLSKLWTGPNLRPGLPAAVVARTSAKCLEAIESTTWRRF